MGAEGCDIIIPVAMPDPSSPTMPRAWALTYFLVQAKNHQDYKLTLRKRLYAMTSLDAAVGDLSKCHAHVTLFMPLQRKEDCEEIEMIHPKQKQVGGTLSRAFSRRLKAKDGKVKRPMMIKLSYPQMA